MTKTTTDTTTKVLRGLVGAIALIAVVAGLWLGYAYASTPAALRHPAHAHYHFRLQIINNGVAVNFAEAKYQTEFNKDICTAKLTKEPVHFHDNLNQFVHIHWAHITGGIVLKDYGWNFIGGPDKTLGYRFDNLPQLVKVPIHGQDLPKYASNAKFYVYTGDQASYKQRNWNDFITQDLQTFFGDTSGKLSDTMDMGQMQMDPLASPSSSPSASPAATEEQLTMLNHVLGSVIIFVQPDKPTDQQIKDRFNHLVPLPESVCGG